MPSTPEEKKKVLTRVRRIRGQMLWNGRWRVMPNAVPYSNRSLPFGARLMG